MIAETGAGQHGVAAATAAALLGLECTVFMGEVDTERQALNVFRMELLGRRGRARSPRAAARSRTRSTRRCASGWRRVERHPLLPRLGDGARTRSPTWSASSSGWSVTRRAASVDAAAGRAARRRGRLRRRRLQRGRHLLRASSTPTPGWSGWRRPAAPRPPTGSPASSTACAPRLLQDEDGQILEAESISAGLDYPGIGPEHAHLAAIGRAEYATADRRRGARRPSQLPRPHRGDHPRARAGPRPRLGRRARPAGRSRAGATVLVTLSGRGDKDVAQVARAPRPAGVRLRARPGHGPLEAALRARRAPGRSCSSPT